MMGAEGAMPIEVLPPEVAAAIAAGEVIERPASAVKELVENALDAGATAISVEIEGGGLRLIRVTDDGCGMAAAELSLAVQRHATSKLRCADDLRGVLTLGFRGEALPSMAAAAELELRSRRPGEAAGAMLEVRDGTAMPPRPAGGPPGTSVTLRDLFGRQPARRKFLRTTGGETAHVAQVVTHFALAYPQVRFALTVDGRRTFESSGSGDLREAAGRVFGVGAAARLLEVRGYDGPPDMLVSGLAGPPDLSRPTRNGIALFVNGRWIQSRRLVYAVESAYETLLGPGRHPVAVIDLRLPPEDLDVNVHPAKAEVRFRDERAVFAALQAAVRSAVIALTPVPQVGALDAPGGAVAEPDGAARALSFWPAPEPADARQGSGPPPLGPAMPLLRVIGQMGTTYIIAEGPDGMYLIDQHAAHERVLYERILGQQAARAPEVQGLLAPATVELTPAQAAVFGTAASRLAELGFDLAPFGERALVARALPAVLAGRDAAAAVGALLDALAEPEAAAEAGADRTTMTLACHAAVRAGMTLSLDEMRELGRRLEGCAAPRTCPHGRPTMMHLSASALDREFRRR
jgi:DNA mismatch repair protein MutL